MQKETKVSKTDLFPFSWSTRIVDSLLMCYVIPTLNHECCEL